MIGRFFGNHEQVDNSRASGHVDTVLVQDEHIVWTFKGVRDLVVFTNQRLLLIDIQGVGMKVRKHAVPYRSISHFSTESSGVADMDTELSLYIGGATQPQIKIPLGRNVDIDAIFRLLSDAML